MNSQVVTPNSEAAILRRLVQAKGGMSRDMADYLLSIEFDASDTERMNVLAETRQGWESYAGEDGGAR